MKLILDESGYLEKLYPFTQIRQVADIRIGILTIKEKWDQIFGVSIETAAEIGKVKDDVRTIPANRIPVFSNSPNLPGSLIVDSTIAIESPWDIIKNNELAIRQDFTFLTKGRKSGHLSTTNTIIGTGEIFIEPGAQVEYSTINTSTGPVYIGKNSIIMEGCFIRGPFALCEGATVKMGAKIYGATTIGPFCTVGGEIKNSVLFGFSNKAHDGYLGDSVVGEWCNLGAGTSNSNIKNSAGEVKAWNNAQQQFQNSGLKCGLLMGDFSRAAINTSFNTGTVVGICCNIFQREFPEKYIPDFSWGKELYKLEKVFEDIDNWKRLKGQHITDSEKKLLSDIYTAQHKTAKDA